MIYLGHSGSDPADSCVIDPTLPVAAMADPAEGLPYWPSFRGLSPGQRRTYLDWLAAGRQMPDIDTGYVFLFFYGLERRLLLEAPDAQEVAALTAELRRLRALYATNGSFDGYSQQLLDAVALLGGGGESFSADPADNRREMSPPLKIAIGREVVAGRPLGFDLAVSGLFGLDAFRAVPPVVNDAGRVLFLAVLRPRFEAEYPGGFRLRDHKNSRLRLPYRGATAGLEVDLAARIGLERLPDPEDLHWSKLVAFAGAVAEEIAPHLRERLWHAARADSLAGLRTCPPELLDCTAREARRWVEALPPLAAVPFAELARQAIGVISAKWTLRQHRLAAEALAQVGRAMEPDPEDGSERLQDDTLVQVFRWSGGAGSAAFGAAATAALFVVNAAGDKPEAGEEAWLARLPGRLALSDEEKRRLQARLAWLRGKKISPAKARRRLAQGNDAQRVLCAWSATIAVVAQGNVGPAEIVRLERIHDALAVPRAALYTELHAGLGAVQAAADEPVAVTPAVAEPLHPIPARPPNGLDPERLARIRAETERSSAMLAEVFSDDEAPAPAEEDNQAGSADLWAGLGVEYAGLATRLLVRPEWSREEFDSLARGAGLMPDGALESINEWAFDRFDEPLVEDGDLIVVNAALLQNKSHDPGAAV